jgi:hypothetical protein
MHYTQDFELRSGTYETGSKELLVASYQLRDGKLVASALQGERKLPESVLELPAGARIGGPANAFEFVTLGRLQLAVDEERTYPSVGFGYPDWKPSVTQVWLKRLADTRLELGGQQHPARHYQTSFKIPLGEFRGELWCDPQGVLLKARLKMPFGTIESVRVFE